MFEFLGRFVERFKSAESRAQEQMQARAWLDDLRQNELSLAARRRIAPDEPARAPGVGHGSLEATTAAPFPADRFARPGAAAARPAPEPGDPAWSTSDAMVDRMIAESSQAGTGGGQFGGAGGTAGFDVETGDASSMDASSGDTASGDVSSGGDAGAGDSE